MKVDVWTSKIITIYKKVFQSQTRRPACKLRIFRKANWYFIDEGKNLYCSLWNTQLFASHYIFFNTINRIWTPVRFFSVAPEVVMEGLWTLVTFPKIYLRRFSKKIFWSLWTMLPWQPNCRRVVRIKKKHIFSNSVLSIKTL